LEAGCSLAGLFLAVLKVLDLHIGRFRRRTCKISILSVGGLCRCLAIGKGALVDRFRLFRFLLFERGGRCIWSGNLFRLGSLGLFELNTAFRLAIRSCCGEESRRTRRSGGCIFPPCLWWWMLLGDGRDVVCSGGDCAESIDQLNESSYVATKKFLLLKSNRSAS
jgi:hypothetical protein